MKITTTRILAVICLILSVFLYIQINQNKKLKQSNKSKDELISYQENEVKLWKDKEGLSRAKANVAELAKEEIQIALDSLLKAQKIKPKNVANSTGIETTSTGTVDIPISTGRGVDTVYIETYPKTFEYANEWDSFHGTIYEKNLELKYAIRDSIVITAYWEGKLLKKKNLVVEAISFNPNTQITGLRQIIKVDEKGLRRISLGPSIVVGFDQEMKAKWLIGFGLQYNLIRL